MADASHRGMEKMDQMVQPGPTTGTDLLVAIHVDGRRLLVAQQEVVSLEGIVDVRRDQAQFPVAGWFEWAGQEWPVYCLQGESLTVTLDVSLQRRACLLLSDGQYGLGLACDQVETLPRPPLAYYPLPLCMEKADALVESLVVHDDETVGCLTTTLRLLAYCGRGLGRELDHG